jgi:hypothetical protein
MNLIDPVTNFGSRCVCLVFRFRMMTIRSHGGGILGIAPRFPSGTLYLICDSLGGQLLTSDGFSDALFDPSRCLLNFSSHLIFIHDRFSFRLPISQATLGEMPPDSSRHTCRDGKRGKRRYIARLPPINWITKTTSATTSRT